MKRTICALMTLMMTTGGAVALDRKLITVLPGGSASVELPYGVSGKCAVQVPVMCTASPSRLGTLTLGRKSVNIMGKTANRKLSHCIDPKGGGLKGKENMSEVAVANFVANTAQSTGSENKGPYGYEQVTLRCKMPGKSKVHTVLSIRVVKTLPKKAMD